MGTVTTRAVSTRIWGLRLDRGVVWRPRGRWYERGRPARSEAALDLVMRSMAADALHTRDFKWPYPGIVAPLGEWRALASRTWPLTSPHSERAGMGLYFFCSQRRSRKQIEVPVCLHTRRNSPMNSAGQF